MNVYYTLSYNGYYFAGWEDETRTTRNWTNDIVHAKEYSAVNSLLLDDLYRLADIGACTYAVIMQVQDYGYGNVTVTPVTA